MKEVDLGKLINDVSDDIILVIVMIELKRCDYVKMEYLNIIIVIGFCMFFVCILFDFYYSFFNYS